MLAWLLYVDEDNTAHGFSLRTSHLLYARHLYCAQDDVLWSLNDAPHLNVPSGQSSLERALEVRGEVPLNLLCLAIFVAFGDRGLEGVAKERRGSFDVVLWVFDELGDCNGIMQSVR